VRVERYRWLSLGGAYRYSAAPGKGDDTRRGQTCEVLVLPRPGSRPANVRVRFADGTVHVVPSGVLRPLTPSPSNFS
jgi:hypothetical protein